MKAVIIAGGAGTRLRPLTYVMPKCMLPVAGKPLLERTISYLGEYGVSDFVVCVAYMKDQIMNSFGDGSRLGVRIEYAEAEVPLGTGGQLKTAESLVSGRFLAMNADIITKMNIGNLIATHGSSSALGTIALKRFEVKVPYGYITVKDDGSIQKFEEKPTLSMTANAGIYVFEHKIFDYIPSSKVTSLERETFPLMLAEGQKLASYFEDVSWADVGSMVDFERVNDEVLTRESSEMAEVPNE